MVPLAHNGRSAIRCVQSVQPNSRSSGGLRRQPCGRSNIDRTHVHAHSCSGFLCGRSRTRCFARNGDSGRNVCHFQCSPSLLGCKQLDASTHWFCLVRMVRCINLVDTSQYSLRNLRSDYWLSIGECRMATRDDCGRGCCPCRWTRTTHHSQVENARVAHLCRRLLFSCTSHGTRVGIGSSVC